MARNVLVIDDKRDVADTVAMLLRLDGCSVEVAYDGCDALRKARQDPPDVALIDLGMPRMNGLELARRLREEWGPRIRLIAHTAWSDAHIKRRAEEAGFDQYLVKPIEPSTLTEAVTFEPEDKPASKPDPAR